MKANASEKFLNSNFLYSWLFSSFHMMVKFMFFSLFFFVVFFRLSCFGFFICILFVSFVLFFGSLRSRCCLTLLSSVTRRIVGFQASGFGFEFHLFLVICSLVLC